MKPLLFVSAFAFLMAAAQADDMMSSGKADQTKMQHNGSKPAHGDAMQGSAMQGSAMQGSAMQTAHKSKKHGNAMQGDAMQSNAMQGASDNAGHH